MHELYLWKFEKKSLMVGNKTHNSYMKLVAELLFYRRILLFMDLNLKETIYLS